MYTEREHSTRESQPSLGTLFKELSADLSTLVRSEIALAKLELKESATSLGLAAGLFVGAAFFALFALAFVLVTIVLALDIVMPAWLAALLVAVALGAGAAVLAMIGKKKMEKIELVPTTAIESVKTDIETFKANITQAREK